MRYYGQPTILGGWRAESPNFRPGFRLAGYRYARLSERGFCLYRGVGEASGIESGLLGGHRLSSRMDHGGAYERIGAADVKESVWSILTESN